MKYFLIILFSFAANAKVFTVSANWSCSRLDISSRTAKLPRSQKLSIRVDSTKGEMKIIPDIFNEVDLSNKDSIVNSTSCVKRLLTKVNKALVKYSSTCANCKVVPKTIVGKLKSQISNSKYLKDKTLSRLPRVYSGHNEYSNLVNASLVKKFCSKGKMNSTELIAISSVDFIEEMGRSISSDKNSYDRSCIDRTKEMHAKFSFKKRDCESKTCKAIYKENDKKEEKYAALETKFNYARNKEDIENLKANGYKKGTSIIKARILSEAIRDPKKCDLNFTVKSNRRFVSIFNYDEAMSELIDKNLKDLSQDCIRSIVKNYIVSKERNLSKDLDLCSSDFCKNQTSKYQENILKLMSYNHSKKQLEYFCQNQPKEKTYSSIINTWNKLDDILMCTELEVGETRVLKNISNSVLGHYHSMKRISDKKFQASLAINFSSDNPEQNKEMRKRVNECISKTSQYFKGPGGEQMDVKVITPDENKKLPESERMQVVDIDIAAKGIGFRSHSKKYKADISCDVITHEMLHLMGLVDEYHEHWNQVYFKRDTKEVYNPRYFPADKNKNDFEKTTAYIGCRSHSKAPSVMSSQHQRFQESVKKQIACECTSSSCTQFMKNASNAKVALFNIPDKYKINKYCKSKYVKAEKLKQNYQFDGQYYRKQKVSESSLEFDVASFSMGENLNSPNLNHYRYSCNCTNDECKKYIKNFKKSYIDKNKFNARSFCFSGSKSIKEKSIDIVGNSTVPYSNDGKGEFFFTTTPDMESLLMPAHFEQMKWGSCSTRSTKYKACAKYAYKSLDFECSDKPKYCDSDEGWLTSTK